MRVDEVMLRLTLACALLCGCFRRSDNGESFDPDSTPMCIAYVRMAVAQSYCVSRDPDITLRLEAVEGDVAKITVIAGSDPRVIFVRKGDSLLLDHSVNGARASVYRIEPQEVTVLVEY